ncbi:MAG: hypothetical protein ACR2FU_25090 [Streptosporangiaceae bacterium]
MSEAGRRREFIRAHHPDLGGDPDAFITGLRSFSTEPGPLPKVIVVRRRSWLARLARAAAQRALRRRPAPRVR